MPSQRNDRQPVSRRRWLGVVILLLAPLVGGRCSPPARDRLMHFFFEIPPPASAPAAESLSSQTAPPVLNARRAAVSVHPPFNSRDCLACHAASNAYQPFEPRTSLCQKCHQPLFVPRAFTHGPFASGSCNQCHAPHVSSLPKLLRDSDPSQCLRCHEMTRFPACYSQKYHIAGRCTACHDPHAADQQFLLKPAGTWHHLISGAAAASQASQPAEGHR